jgi:hypothetical protein
LDRAVKRKRHKAGVSGTLRCAIVQTGGVAVDSSSGEFFSNLHHPAQTRDQEACQLRNIRKMYYISIFYIILDLWIAATESMR